MAGTIGAINMVERFTEQMRSATGEANASREKQGSLNPNAQSNANSGTSFAAELEKAIHGVNDKQKVADGMSMNLTTGRTGNIHETMLAATQAELSFNLMVQLRNKGLEAYNEIMRMPV